MRKPSRGASGLSRGVARRGRRGFTLIELLVVLAIISMILSLAVVAIMSLLRTSYILAATDIIRSAVSRTRSSAISSRKSCTLDMSYTEATSTTEKLTTSAILTAEDFERYDADWDAVKEEAIPRKAEESSEFMENWSFSPALDAWEIVPEQSRELWVGRGMEKTFVGNSYAWSKASRRGAKKDESTEVTVQARFRARRIKNPQREWAFGLLAHFDRVPRCQGYRFAVRVQTESQGWNFYSRAKLEKINSSSSQETYYDANDPDPDNDLLAARDLDEFQAEVSSAVTPGVWYWTKLNLKYENKVLTIAGKVWVEGAPEPTAWTVGPVVDAFPGVKLPPDARDNIAGAGGDEPLLGGCSGVWVNGAATAVDDFAVDWREQVFLPKHIHLQPQCYDTSTGTFEPLARFEEGSFPLSYRPDGTATAMRPVFLVITNVSSGERRLVQIDHNTGRVEVADEFRVQQ